MNKSKEKSSRDNLDESDLRRQQRNHDSYDFDRGSTIVRNESFGERRSIIDTDYDRTRRVNDSITNPMYYPEIENQYLYYRHQQQQCRDRTIFREEEEQNRRECLKNRPSKYEYCWFFNIYNGLCKEGRNCQYIHEYNYNTKLLSAPRSQKRKVDRYIPRDYHNEDIKRRRADRTERVREYAYSRTSYSRNKDKYESTIANRSRSPSPRIYNRGSPPPSSKDNITGHRSRNRNRSRSRSRSRRNNSSSISSFCDNKSESESISIVEAEDLKRVSVSPPIIREIIYDEDDKEKSKEESSIEGNDSGDISRETNNDNGDADMLPCSIRKKLHQYHANESYSFSCSVTESSLED